MFCGRSSARRRSCAGTATSCPQPPEDLNGCFAFLTVPPGAAFPEELHLQKTCGDRVVLHRRPPTQADEALAPIRALGTPALDGVGPMPYPALQSTFDALYPPGLQWYWRADFFERAHRRGDRRRTREYGAAAADLALDDAPLPDRRRGAAASARTTPRSATATPTWAEVIVGVDPDPANAERDHATGRVDYWDGAAPVLGGRRLRELHDGRGPGPGAGHLPRQLRPAGRGQGGTTTRSNLFRVNQNIPPAI